MMANMLIVSAFELSNPMLLVVLVETYDSLFHRGCEHADSCGADSLTARYVQPTVLPCSCLAGGVHILKLDAFMGATAMV